MSTFSVRLNEGPEQTITVETGIYQHAAVAALAILGVDELPAVVEIWSRDLIPEYSPYFYIIDYDEFLSLRVRHALPSVEKAGKVA